jgi:hypothetical protein
LQVAVVALFGALALLHPRSASAASGSKSCSQVNSTTYSCVFTIIPGVATGAGSWLVKTSGGTLASAVVTSSSGCINAPAVTAGGTLINPNDGVSDYNVTVTPPGCNAAAVVSVTETITVTSGNQICQSVWITAAMPPVVACATVSTTPPPPMPSATKSCTLTSTPNRYACLFTVTPAFPAVANDLIHVNEAPGPLMTGPGTIVGTPTVASVNGCAQTPSPVVSSSPTSYNARIGVGGCPGVTWSVQFLEVIDVTANGQICQSFWMVAAVPPTTACASVTYTPVGAAGTSKTCVKTSTQNVYTCTFIIAPGVVTGPGPWLVQMVTPGPGSFSGPSVVSSSTTGCTNTPSITAGTLISTPAGNSDYNVTIGAGGCTAGASVVITETVTVTSSGELCQKVWITAGMLPQTACATIEFTRSLIVPGGTSFTGGTIAPSGVSLVSFTGSTQQLDAAGMANSPKITTVSATSGGKLITFVIGAPPFVNSEFNMAFPNGLNNTLVIVKTG